MIKPESGTSLPLGGYEDRAVEKGCPLPAHAEILWSEDFNSGQNYNGVIAMNPLTGS